MPILRQRQLPRFLALVTKNRYIFLKRQGCAHLRHSPVLLEIQVSNPNFHANL
jgi:hypothetical protein